MTLSSPVLNIKQMTISRQKLKKSFFASILSVNKFKSKYIGGLKRRWSFFTPGHIDDPTLHLKIKALRCAENDQGLFLANDGCGGVYMLFDAEETQTIAVFKPREEEYMAPKNPKGYKNENAIVGKTEHPIRKGFYVGNGAIMEKAAYLLDRQYNHFSGVPVTSLVKINSREGSLQEFVPSISSAEDMGTGCFEAKEVQKVGILDVRMFNTDRHASNILLSPREEKNGTYKMTPIDHGFCLPTYHHLEGASFDWLYWPQAKMPLDEKALAHIKALNIEKDAQILRSCGVNEDSVTTMRLSTLVLKKAADIGLNLYEIGNLLQRSGDGSNPSSLELALMKIISENDAELKKIRKDKKATGDLLFKKADKIFHEMVGKKARSKSSVI